MSIEKTLFSTNNKAIKYIYDAQKIIIIYKKNLFFIALKKRNNITNKIHKFQSFFIPIFQSNNSK